MAEQLATTLKVGDTVFRTVFHVEADKRGDFYLTMTDEGRFLDESVSARLDADEMGRLIEMLAAAKRAARGDE